MTGASGDLLLSPGRLAVICAARILLFATFMTIAAAIPVLQAEWDISAGAAGAIVTSFTLGYALSLFAFSWGSDRVGAKRMVVVSAVAAALTSLLFGVLARDWMSAFILYGLVGLSQGGVYTPLIVLLADETPRERRGTAMGWLIGSTSLGYAASLAVVGLTLAIGGWRLAFIVSGLLPAIGAAILIAALSPLPNRIHPRHADGGVIRQMIGNRRARLLVAGYTAHTWELLGMWAWVPAFLAASFALHGAGVANATVTGAYLAGLMHLCGAFAALAMGGASDRFGRRPMLILMALLATIISFAIGWLIAVPPLLLVPLAFLYAFACIGDSPILSTALSETVAPGSLGAVLAWRSLLGFGAGAIAPLIVGLVLDTMRVFDASPGTAWGVGFAVLGIGGALATICAQRLGRATG